MLPPFVDLRLQLEHRRPVRLEKVQLLGVVALEPHLLHSKLRDHTVRSQVRYGVRACVAQLVETRFLGDSVRDDRRVVAIELLEI